MMTAPNINVDDAAFHYDGHESLEDEHSEPHTAKKPNEESDPVNVVEESKFNKMIIRDPAEATEDDNVES